MKVALAVLGCVVLALVVAARVPKSAQALEDVPVLGWVIDLIGVHDSGPVEVEVAFDHAPSAEELARARDLLAERLPHATVSVRGTQLFVLSEDPLNVYELKLHRPPMRVFTVVYESPELEALRRTLLRDDQAKKLGLVVMLDTVGYHISAPSDSLYVNPAWAEKHHCEGHHIEGTGTACYLTAKERFDAYVRGDPDLFVDAHPIELPPGRNFYATDEGPIYELDAEPLEMPLSRVHFTREAALIPLAAEPAPDEELVVEVSPGTLIVGKSDGKQLAIPSDPALELASFGLRVR